MVMSDFPWGSSTMDESIDSDQPGPSNRQGNRSVPIKKDSTKMEIQKVKIGTKRKTKSKEKANCRVKELDSSA